MRKIPVFQESKWTFSLPSGKNPRQCACAQEVVVSDNGRVSELQTFKTFFDFPLIMDIRSHAGIKLLKQTLSEFVVIT